MQFDSTNAMRLDLQYQKTLLRSFSKRRGQLCNYDNFSLLMQHKGTHPRYYLTWRESGKEMRKYLGVNQQKTIDNIKEKYFLDQAISSCKTNIYILEKALQDYSSLDPNTMTQYNPKPYRNPDDYSQLLFSQQTKSQWQRKMQHEKDKYTPYKPQQLRHRAADGTLTRSKSEALIYNLLLSKNIPFIYELPTFIGGELKLPDFTIYDQKQNQIVIIEHMGLMVSGTYCEDQMEKLQNYISNGWVPNVNLILTFDDINGNIDTNAINNIIDLLLS